MARNETGDTGATRLPAFLADVQLQTCKRGSLLGMKPYYCSKPLCWRKRWIDQRDASLNVGDDARFGGRQK